LLAYYGGALPTITAGDSLTDSATTTENNNAGGFIINGTTASEYMQGTQDTFLPAANFYDNYDATIVTDPSSQVIANNPLKFRASSSGLFQVTYSGTHDIDFSFMTGVTLYCDYSVILMTKKNNVLIGNDVIYSGLLNMGIMPVATVSFTFSTSQTINMLINDELTFEIRLDRNQGQIFGAAVAPLSFTQTVTSTGVSLDIIKSQQALTPGSAVTLNPFLPDMTCDVFLKGIITAFNLYLKPDANNPTILEIEPLADFYNGSDNAIDWTYLVDKSKEIKVTPTINFASKDYNFLFEKEDDYWNTQYVNAFIEQYGSFTLSSQSQYATDTTDMKLPFGQHPLALIDTTNLIVPRFYQVNFDEFGNGQIVLKKGKSFIVQLGEMRAGNWIHRNESGIDIPQTIYPYVGHLDDIDNPTFDFNFGVPEVVYYPATIYTSNNLYQYHERFIKEIVSRFGKMLTLYATIDSDIINRLDFRNLINIDAVVYRLQKINDYDSGKGQSTLIELIRIIEGESEGTIEPPSHRITENGIVRREQSNLNQRIIE
jgi:hypothetical protein